MIKTMRRWQPVLGCAAAGVAVVAGVSGAVATADPVVPSPVTPGYPPVTVTQTVTVAPPAVGAAAPAPATAPGAVSAPGPVGAPGPVRAPGPGVPATASAPSTLVPASSGTLRDFFAEHAVQLDPQQPTAFTALNITLPMPAGWTHVPDPNVPDAFAVIADRHSGSLYAPNAQLVVYRLVGQFDPKEAISHGYVDSQRQMAWQTTNASLADFYGFPSSVIEGTYRDGDMTLNTSRRHVIVPVDGSAYLVTLTVTTGAGRAIGTAPATDGIISGFRVALPTAPPLP